MFRTKTIVLFLVKAIVIYILFSISFSFYDELYGNLFRKSSGLIFQRFHQNGFVKLSSKDKPYITRLYVGNYTQVKPDGTAHCAIYEVNTRHFGYLPTVLLFSLILASPVKWKRMVISFLIGFILVSGLIIFKEWIYIQHICIEKPWLMLYDFSESRKSFIEHFFNSYINPTAPSLLFMVIIWILVTFNRKDFVVKEVTPAKPGVVRKSG
ncbi:MAG: hypothetical protein NTX61_10110 [Bacteroidetes bacterium]|nr:hypothetical protein [Bacteroidota bacterium]